MLTIDNLHAKIENKNILNGLSLNLAPGEVHAIMGPNGSGKSTLANILAGRSHYEITQGKMLYQGQDLTTLAPEERAREGIFLALQYPVEIPGVSNIYFLKTALNEIRKHRKLTPLDAMDFTALVKEKMQQLKMPEELLYRAINTDFSGGEKKRNEMLQMLLLEPSLIILDETDSGLDIDALKIIADSVNQMRAPNRSFLVITHYQRLLDHIEPDHVHVLAKGKITQSGDKTLAHALEQSGYQQGVTA